VDKRSADSPDGRNLLMAYLGNVGGYDREYRSVEDENKPGNFFIYRKVHPAPIDYPNRTFFRQI
jgi:hypothetical protein